MLPEFAAVIARRDLDDPRPARGAETEAHRLFYRLTIDAVDDDLQHRVDRFRQLARHTEPAANRRAVRFVGRRDHVLVAPRADLAAGADDAAGKRQDDAADP